MVSQTVKKLRDTKDNDNDTDVDVDVDVGTDRDTGTGYNSDSLSTIVPKKRNIHFKLSDELVGTFHHQGHFVSLFFAALSIFFPTGESKYLD
jgi:hypothetical protein